MLLFNVRAQKAVMEMAFGIICIVVVGKSIV